MKERGGDAETREERKGLHDERESRQDEDGWYLRGGRGEERKGARNREGEGGGERREREEGGERGREREREIYPQLPASQSASPGQHRPGIVASALASLLSRTINLASIPDHPFSVSPFVLVCACVPELRVRTCRACIRMRYGHAVPAQLARGIIPRESEASVVRQPIARPIESMVVEVSRIRE